MSYPIQVKYLPEPLRSAIRSMSRKRNAILTRADYGIPLAIGWDGGSRSAFSTVNLFDGRSEPLAGNSESAWFLSKRTTPTFTPTVGVALVETGMFRGKPSTPTIYLDSEAYASIVATCAQARNGFGS